MKPFLIDGPLMDNADRIRLMVERMAECLVASDTFRDPRDAMTTLRAARLSGIRGDAACQRCAPGGRAVDRGARDGGHMTSFPQRILRPFTAFSLTSMRVKHPRVTNRNHVSFIHKLPCIVCGTRRNIEAAHVKMGNPLYGKSEGGTLRPNDSFILSLCAAHHDEQHSMNEAEFWKALDIDPLKLALALFDASGDEERAELIIRSHRGER